MFTDFREKIYVISDTRSVTKHCGKFLDLEIKMTNFWFILVLR